MPNLLTGTNTKTIRGEVRGYRTLVLHLAPYNASGINVCRNASPGCINFCLVGTGHLAMYGEIQSWRTVSLFRDSDEFYSQLYDEMVTQAARAERKGLQPVFRLNGTSDLPWESMSVFDGGTIFDAFPDYQFYDYTKYPYHDRVKATRIPNYHLTYSWSEGPARLKPEQRQAFVSLAAEAWYEHGVNTAVVFGRYHREKSILPAEYDLGFGPVPVIDGDVDDLRFLDERNVIVGLRAKFKSYDKLDESIASGFVVPGHYRGREHRPSSGTMESNPPKDVAEVSGSETLAHVVDFNMGSELDRDLAQFFNLRGVP